MARIICTSTTSSSSSSDSFTIVQPDTGTAPTAESATDTLTLTSTGSVIVITGNATTDTIDFTLGTSVVTLTGTQTLTNKRITQRVVTLTDAATVTPNADTTDIGILTSLSQTTDIANPSGTPTNLQPLELRIKSASAQSLTFGNQFRSGADVTLPTATTGSSKTDYFGFKWNSADSKWDILAKATGY